MTGIRSAFRPATLIAQAVLFASTMLVVACSGDPSAPAGSALGAPSFARAPSDVVVSSAVPDSANQDTTLDVTINGSGFASGAVAKWALAGVTDSTQVRTNSTRFLNSRQLVANVTISGTATIGKWDVIVTAGTKGGIGSELFTIKVKPQTDLNSRAMLTWDSQINVAAPGSPIDVQAAGIADDGRDTYGNPSATPGYQGNYCGVQGSIFWMNDSVNSSGDLVFDPDKDYSAKSLCPSKRTLSFYLSYAQGGARGSATAIGAFTNARMVMQLAAGASRVQRMRFWYIGLKNCDRLDFDSTLGGGATDVRLSRLPNLPDGSGQWHVESIYPHLAMCTITQSTVIAKGTRYLPFAFTVTEVRYPYPSHQ